MSRFIVIPSAIFCAVFSGLMLLGAIGEALNGGLRINAQPVARVMEPAEADAAVVPDDEFPGDKP